MDPTRMSILGVGLLGGSIGLAAKAAAMPCRVVGYGHRLSTLQRALEVGAIDESAPSAAAAVAGADLIVLCTPVGLFEPILREIASSVAPGAILTDVGSTKRSVVQLAESTLPHTAQFVGSHPMAGSEKRGIEYARTDLFQGATCILTPTNRTDPTALESIDAFWRRLGMRTQRMTPEEHDERICDVSHLPHAVAAALIAMQSDEALPLAGKGFLDTTRIAGGDGALWRDIFHDNRDNVAKSIHSLSAQLKQLIDLLDPAKADELAQWLDQAAERRARLLAEKLKELQ
jgi:prephenate dehydrogenase